MPYSFSLRSLVAATCLLAGTVLLAQKTPAIREVTPEEYQRMKVGGELPMDNTIRVIAPPFTTTSVNHGQPKGGGGGNQSSCNLWADPTGCPLSQGPNDDSSSPLINLPFAFNLYGQTYNGCWINNNGSLTFNAPLITWSAAPFPTTQYVMVAPFWADVDTRGGAGEVVYCVSDHYMQVTWLNVGYFNQQSDKLNSFQVTITDGTAEVIGVGNNVCFSYQNMEWTTGSASGGTNGFGGTPAVVGSNLGDGVGYIQIGIFDHAGTDYNGPNTPSGVGWLAYKDFVFSTLVPSANIAPIATGNFICDTIAVCSGELVDVNVSFLSPEVDQLTTPSFSAPDFPQFNPTLTTGNTGTIIGQFVPTDAQVGYHTIVFTGTDNGSPNLSQETTVVVNVTPSPGAPPVISGDTVACAGQGVVLTASGGYQHYQWSNNWNDSVVLVGPGTYYVEASTGACILVSNTIVVHEAPTPSPVINGVLFNCGGDPAVLTTDTTYSSYSWSNGSTSPSISVGTGTYSVTVTNDEGCSGTSASVNVNSANSPTASFIGNPNGTVFPGATVTYTNQSNPNGGTIVSVVWTTDSIGGGNGNTFTHTFTTPGEYHITLTVTTADGCTGTYTYVQIVVPVTIIIPNVFSPNNDGENDALAFEGAQYYPNTSLSVFNRWGQEVYSSTNYKNTWKPGKDIPEGTYFFILKLINGDEYTGNVTLLR